MKAFFSDCGAVESVRIRSIPIGDPKLPRKAAYILKEFHKERDTANAYVVFKEPTSVEKALLNNQTVFMDKHIRVDSAATPTLQQTNSVFVGNLAYSA